MPLVRCSTKGQLVIPADIRKRKGFTPGTYIMVEEQEDGVFLKSVGEDPVKACSGMLAQLGPLNPGLLRDRREDKQREERKAGWSPRRPR